MIFIKLVLAIVFSITFFGLFYGLTDDQIFFGFACELDENCELGFQMIDLLNPIFITIFTILGALSSAASSIALRNRLKEVGFYKLFLKTIKSTDFALSIFLFPFLFLVIIKATAGSSDIILTLIFAFETGFVTKAILENLSARQPSI